jgi:hypothetical protein
MGRIAVYLTDAESHESQFATCRKLVGRLRPERRTCVDTRVPPIHGPGLRSEDSVAGLDAGRAISGWDEPEALHSREEEPCEPKNATDFGQHSAATFFRPMTIHREDGDEQHQSTDVPK